MAWYAPTLATVGIWTRRVMISVDLTAGGGAQDVDITIPKSFDDFWNLIDASGFELRVVSPNSEGLAAYSVDNGAGGAFDRANRLGRIRVDAFSFISFAGMSVLWLYYGSSSAQGTAAVATVIAGSVAGYIELGRPPLVRRFAYAPSRPGYQRPTSITSKTAGEIVDLWIDVSPALEFRQGLANAGIYHEECAQVVLNVYNAALVDQPAMYDQTRIRWVFHQKTGRTWLRVSVFGGTSGSAYVVVPSVYTLRPGDAVASSAQKLHPYIALLVRDLVPPS